MEIRLAGMQPQVVFQTVRGGERRATKMTDESFVAGVNSLVPSRVTRDHESFAAVSARVSLRG